MNGTDCGIATHRLSQTTGFDIVAPLMRHSSLVQLFILFHQKTSIYVGNQGILKQSIHEHVQMSQSA